MRGRIEGNRAEKPGEAGIPNCPFLPTFPCLAPPLSSLSSSSSIWSYSLPFLKRSFAQCSTPSSSKEENDNDKFDANYENLHHWSLPFSPCDGISRGKWEWSDGNYWSESLTIATLLPFPPLIRMMKLPILYYTFIKVAYHETVSPISN